MFRSPSIGAIAVLGLMLVAIFLVWVAVAQSIYVAYFGYTPAAAMSGFLHQVLTTPAGWGLIIVGNGVGFLFAVLALTLSVVSFPLLLDRDVGAATAILTSVRAVLANPLAMAAWGLIVAALLALGSLPALLGLTVVLPVLGHATWHLYRRVVEPDDSDRPRFLEPTPQGAALRGRLPGVAVSRPARRARRPNLLTQRGAAAVPAAAALAEDLEAGVGDDHRVLELDEAARGMLQRGLDRDHHAAFERAVRVLVGVRAPARDWSGAAPRG